MLILNKLQKTIYETLNNQTSDNFQKLTGIFNYVEKNKSFPYIFISSDEIKNLSTTSKEIYSVLININIFSNDTSNYYINCLVNEIRQLLKNPNNFNIKDYLIIDIKFNSYQIKLENNGTIWNGNIKTTFIISTI